MKLSIKGETVFLHPECNLDCYHLGKAQFPKCTITFIKDSSGAPEPGTISHMEVPMFAFFNYLFK